MTNNPRTDDANIRDQYRNASKLETRIGLHERFSTNLHPWQRWVFDQISLPDNASILELGCGTARLWTENLDRIPSRWSITLTDASHAILDQARSNITFSLNYTTALNFTFTPTDARSLPFGEDEFDAVISNHMLYHIPDRDRIFAEVQRVLKPDGAYFATTNGERNMEEMARFRQILNPQYRLGDESQAFSLENGAEQLEQSFASVALRKRQDGLRVTESEPFIEYLLSMMDVREVSNSISTKEFDDRVAKLTEMVEEKIRSQGFLDITKSVGMFVAKV